MVGDYMKAFKVDDKGDLVIENGDLVMIEGDQELIQSVERRLGTNKGEWFLDTEFGLDYGAIRGKGVTKDRAELVITEAVYQDDRIEDTALVGHSIDNKLRFEELNLAIQAKNGEELEIDSLEEVILIE